MKRITPHSSISSEIEINMSPMIDCVFLLLIFFIVTSVFMEETGVEVNKPSAVSAADLEKQSLMVALTSSGKIVYGGREIDINSVRGIISQQLHNRDIPVIIMADRKSSTGQLVELMDECKLGGATRVSVAAQRK
jgi:biopolymer transport protein ExbD